LIAVRKFTFSQLVLQNAVNKLKHQLVKYDQITGS